MIDRILPRTVVAVETRRDAKDGVLFPQEEEAIRRAVDVRRREFATVRACARQAFAQLGLPPAVVANGKYGEPLWPAGVVGSMTHCEGYRACVLARRSVIATVGIDATPHAALGDQIVNAIAGPAESVWLATQRREAPEVRWERLLFSAKETAYKAWFPLGKRRLGFEDAVVTFNVAERSFAARMLVPAPTLDGALLLGFTGRWLIAGGLVLTAIAVPRRPSGSAHSPKDR